MSSTERALLAVTLSLLLPGCPDDRSTATDATAPSLDATPFDCGLSRPVWGRGEELMLPGVDCLGCHQPGGWAPSVFSVAGTVFATRTCPRGLSGATVHVTDSRGREEDLTTNEEGNFFSRSALRPPFQVSLRVGAVTWRMSALAESGGCNACHDPDAGTPYLGP